VEKDFTAVGDDAGLKGDSRFSTLDSLRAFCSIAVVGQIEPLPLDQLDEFFCRNQHLGRHTSLS
jgi:hypothetical protein